MLPKKNEAPMSLDRSGLKRKKRMLTKKKTKRGRKNGRRKMYIVESSYWHFVTILRGWVDSSWHHHVWIGNYRYYMNNWNDGRYRCQNEKLAVLEGLKTWRYHQKTINTSSSRLLEYSERWLLKSHNIIRDDGCRQLTRLTETVVMAEPNPRKRTRRWKGKLVKIYDR